MSPPNTRPNNLFPCSGRYTTTHFSCLRSPFPHPSTPYDPHVRPTPVSSTLRYSKADTDLPSRSSRKTGGDTLSVRFRLSFRHWRHPPSVVGDPPLLTPSSLSNYLLLPHPSPLGFKTNPVHPLLTSCRFTLQFTRTYVYTTNPPFPTGLYACTPNSRALALRYSEPSC